MRLRAIGPATAETISRELLFRDFRNRRQVGAYLGLWTPSPYQSGDVSHDRGISHAGNRHLRGPSVDLAWAWLSVPAAKRTGAVVCEEVRDGRGEDEEDRDRGACAQADHRPVALQPDGSSP